VTLSLKALLSKIQTVEKNKGVCNTRTTLCLSIQLIDGVRQNLEDKQKADQEKYKDDERSLNSIIRTTVRTYNKYDVVI